MPDTSAGERPPAVESSKGVVVDLVVVGVCAALVTAAISIGSYLNNEVPSVTIYAPAAPLYARWEPHSGIGTLFAVVLALAVIAVGPALASRMRWRALLAVSYLGAVGWTFSLIMVDGYQRGFINRLNTKFEYLAEVPGITDIPAMIAEFAERIPVGHPQNWAVHVSGHPPGATLVYVWLDRIGLSGAEAASAVTLLVACLIAVMVPVTVKALSSDSAARAVVPFAVLFPGAVWMGVSADGLFAGVIATGIAALAVATRVPAPWREVLAGAAGLILGFGVFLSYGFVLFGPLALAVVAYRRAWRVLAVAVTGALAVVAVFATAGFWWLDGYFLVVERYYADLGTSRPYWYWAWANLAALVLMAGIGVFAGVGRTALDALRNRRLDAVALLVAGGLVAIIAADLSGMSKAETERIWLPFAVWLLPAVALLPERSRRWWLAAQAATAIAVNHLIWTWW